MVQVESLTKLYGRQRAVNDVSFTVARGDVVGLLGPNGAGKSTILRILSAYLPATSGTVRIAGLDVATQSEAVRRRIGYMPESNPLHPEMRVREYLKFRGRLKGLGIAESRHRVDQVTDECGLTDVSHRIIGTLSKGYRQRVGLADALVHSPDLIILDEPTIGLDPHQIRSVRATIQSLGKTRTVLLSSHILSEVEATCRRVLILYEGRVVAADTAENLRRRVSGGTVVAEIAAPLEALRDCWPAGAGLERVELTAVDSGYVRCRIEAASGQDLRAEVFQTVVRHGWTLRELTQQQQSLEDVFLQVTRKEPVVEPVEPEES
jgi:ABC-2 type transport system ATP-binding protein